MSIMRLVACAALLAAAAPAPAQRALGWTGVWRNKSDSVRIRVAPCGAGLCGTVIEASGQAKADAAAGGTGRLVGTELFRDFRREEDGLWHGQVYVPDIGQTFEGTVEQVNRDTIVGSGCLIAGFGCKTKTWVRVR